METQSKRTSLILLAGGILLALLLLFGFGLILRRAILPATHAAAQSTPPSQASPATQTPVPSQTTVPPVEAVATILPTPASPAKLLSPLLSGAGFGDIAWSPDGQYLAFFSQTAEDLASQKGSDGGPILGTFNIYNPRTGETCQYAQKNESGLRFNQWHAWLPDGRLASAVSGGKIAVLNQPCGSATLLVKNVPAGAEEVLGSANNGKTFLLSGPNGCWLYSIALKKTARLASCSRDFSFSPDGAYLGMTSRQDGIHYLTSIYQVPGGKPLAEIPWTYSSGGLGNFPGPVWMSSQQIIVLRTDIGPLQVTLGKKTKIDPISSLVGIPGTANQAATTVTASGGAYTHILLHDYGASYTTSDNWLYHPESGEVEEISFDDVAFSADGRSLNLVRRIHSGDYEQSERWQRAVDPSGSEPARLPETDTQDFPAWSLDGKLYAIAVQPEAFAPVTLSVRSGQDESVQKSWLLKPFSYQLSWSPDASFIVALGLAQSPGDNALYILSIK